MLFGSEGEKVLWEAVDRALFGEGDPRARFLELTGELGEFQGRCGQTLRRLRRKVQKTPTEAAREAGLEPARWRHWEANAALMSEAELEQVSQVVASTQAERRELLREHRRAPAVYFERVFRSWERSSRRVARSTEDEIQPEKSTRTVLEQLDSSVLSRLRAWCSSRLGGPPGLEDLERAMDQARAMGFEQRRRWIQEVLESAEDERR